MGGGSVNSKDSLKLKRLDHLKGEPDLPIFSNELESALNLGKSVKVEGTNVVRVPFGIRQAIKQRPAKPETWATLVIPFQPLGSPPTPPQAA